MNSNENGSRKIPRKSARQQQQRLHTAGGGADCQNASVRHARSPARQPGEGTAETANEFRGAVGWAKSREQPLPRTQKPAAILPTLSNLSRSRPRGQRRARAVSSLK